LNRFKTQTKTVLRWEQGANPKRQRDQLAVEEPLEIRVDTQSIAVTMRTPGDDSELVAGFLVSEGLIRHRTDILKIVPYARNKPGNVIEVFLSPDVPIDFTRLTRHVYASSSCGLCGKATIAAVHHQFKKLKMGFKFGAQTLLTLPGQLRQAQEAFEVTGGLHAAGIFDRRGKLLVLHEDVGRHNAVDKVLGYGFLNGLLPFDRHILMVSGRASFEILQKALAARIPIVAAVSAPSSLAVQFASESRQTLVGFLRGERMNVYTKPERLRFQPISH
jgi:FdhD protein